LVFGCGLLCCVASARGVELSDLLPRPKPQSSQHAPVADHDGRMGNSVWTRKYKCCQSQSSHVWCGSTPVRRMSKNSRFLRHQLGPLQLRQVALGIAGNPLTIVDTCLQSSWLAVVAAKTRGKAAKLMHRLIWARLGKEAIYLVFSEVKILSWDVDGNPRRMPCAFVFVRGVLTRRWRKLAGRRPNIGATRYNCSGPC